MPDLTRPRLTALRNGLLRWHKSLLDAERAAYERDVARITSTGQYFGLVLGDPWFAWLREVSQFIVIVDETLDRKEPPATAAEAARLIAQARELLVPAGTSDFARRYAEAIDRDPAAVLAHGAMMQVFAELDKEPGA